jgi:SAM-dependent methyltransferase
MSAALSMAPAPSPIGAHPWDEAAAGWDHHSALLGEWLHEATAALLDAARIAPGSRVLDIAAGAGEQTLDIARRVGPAGFVLATDISPRILGLARDKLHRAGYSGVQTRVSDAQDLGAAIDASEAHFDAAVSRLGLMFCRAPLAALSGARAALKPGGRYAALVFSQPATNPCIATLAATARRHAGLPPGSPFEPGTLLSLGQPGLMLELLAAAGFVEIEVRALSAPMRLPSCRHYIDFVSSAGLPIQALLAPLSAAAQGAAWDDVAQQLDRYTTTEGWVGPKELLLCSATAPAAT